MTQSPLPQAPAQYDQRWASALIDQLERIHQLLSLPAETGYATSNVTTTRVIDADSTSTAEIADVLCTLIEDMKAKGRLSK
tara:strand:+ start:56 stop:298 length:243 start_codon:yes stop_codon:yes gene_type:complete